MVKWSCRIANVSTLWLSFRRCLSYLRSFAGKRSVVKSFAPLAHRKGEMRVQRIVDRSRP